MAEWDYKNFWEESLAMLRKDLGDDEYGIWFNQVEYIRAEEAVIFVSAPSKIIADRIYSKYLNQITGLIGELAGKNLAVTLEVQKKGGKPREQAPPAGMAHTVPGGKNSPLSRSPGTPRGPDSAAGEEKNRNALQLQEEYTFETYVVGEVNNFAYNAASAVARNPGTNKIYNPLLIYGGTGLGKTHLMQAIGHYINLNSDLKVLYITGEGFMREFVEIFSPGQKSNKDSFAKKYRNADVLLIDDIHTIERGAGTQDELFYTFEALYNKKKQMVFTCDRPITELKGMAPRLQTRFQWGLSVELNLPRYEERIAILKKKMEMKKTELKKDIAITGDIIELIAKNITTNVRDMEGALNKLMGYADLVNKPVTMEIAQRELKDIFADPKQGNMSIDIIQRIVAEDFHLTPNDLKGKKRSAGIAKPRQIAMYLCRELSEYSLTEIGEAFNKDHSTVLHSCNKIEEESHSDTNLYTVLEKLKRMIKEYNFK